MNASLFGYPTGNGGRYLLGLPTGRGGEYLSIYGRRFFVFEPVISAPTLNYNVRAAAIAAGWNQSDPLIVRGRTASGVYVGSASVSTWAFDTDDNYPVGSSLYWFNEGLVVGIGGNGGAPNGGAGTAGGPALRARFPIRFDNSLGVVGGGGGGGGGGQYTYNVGGDPKNPTTWAANGGNGGGGRGFNGGSPNGSSSAAGGGYGGGWSGVASGGTGGSGGNLGAAGGSGGGASAYGSGGVGSGGAAGAAVDGNRFIDWVNVGTRMGAINT